MNRFLEELDNAPKPTLAQRSIAIAGDYARNMARQDEAGAASLELKPNAAQPDPFSLSMYVDGLIKRLNRSAAYVKNDPRNKGIRTASVQFRINPDGTLKSFDVINEGDQADEVAYIRSVVERSIPFSPFPEDINKSARSLTMTICIRPAGSGGDVAGLEPAIRGQRILLRLEVALGHRRPLHLQVAEGGAVGVGAADPAQVAAGQGGAGPGPPGESPTAAAGQNTRGYKGPRQRRPRWSAAAAAATARDDRQRGAGGDGSYCDCARPL